MNIKDLLFRNTLLPFVLSNGEFHLDNYVGSLNNLETNSFLEKKKEMLLFTIKEMKQIQRNPINTFHIRENRHFPCLIVFITNNFY